jgi:hypothetical protein
MSGFASHGLDEDDFGEKGNNIVQAFDAFRKSSPTIQGLLGPARSNLYLRPSIMIMWKASC